ncbi:MAG: hypothetical protein ACREBV_09030 [Candidatus Zixiibacteriota bacterium]
MTQSVSQAAENGIKITGTLLRLVAMVVGIAAAYFLTIQSLKIELAAKAEASVVEKLDKKLNNIEVILKESLLSKEQFYTFSNNMETRLNRIEYQLGEITGEKIGQTNNKK